MPFVSVSDDLRNKSYVSVENKFITKYLPILEANAVKVYLFALYIFQSGQSGYTLTDLATKLEMTEEDAKNYFTYLEEFELVSITSLNPFEVKILECDNVYGTPKKIKPEKYADFSIEVQSIISGRMISTNEFLEYYLLLEEYGFERNALLMIISYCVNLKGNDIRFQYIKKVAKSFADDGLTTAKKVEKKLSSYTTSTPALIKLFSTCSINRQPDIEDDKLYLKWSNEMGFTDEAIIAGAKYFKAKSIEKIDSAMTELYNNKKFDVKEIDDYCKNKNSVYQLTFDIARSLGVYIQNIAPYVENYTTNWINYGFDRDALLLISNHCFMHGKNSFATMNDFLIVLYDEGIVTTDSVKEKIAKIDSEEKLINTILTTCGLTRKIIPMDKDCLKRWKNWGFSDEMLIECARLSSGTNNPISYMNAILSTWKNDGIFTIDKIAKQSSASKTSTSNKTSTTKSNSSSTQTRDNKALIEAHYYDLRHTAEQRAEQNLANAMKDEVYSELRKRINSLSIELAFAEARGVKGTETEKQIKTLEAQADKRLAELHIDKAGFLPNYSCKKCNDTGYDSTGKQCDCLKKFMKENNLI
jgi:DNA replication protein DnaD